MREIKFRAWDKEFKKFSTIALENLIEDINYLTDYEWSQYTGLKDKNGKEIYEGDILKGRKYYITVVFYKGMFSGKQHGVSYSEPLASWEMNCFEIIGNIYENPELLKVN